MANGKPILVVEDDPDIQESFRDVLEAEGYTVQTASNGRDALKLLETIPAPGLILLDLMMPVMNGWEFATAIATKAWFPEVPIVVISAFPEKAAPIPYRAVVRKPVDLDTLLAAVTKHWVA